MDLDSVADMETPPPSQRIVLSDLLRRNARRIRQLRRLSVRDLAGRLDVLNSPIAASGVTKLENGTRAVSIADWAALAAVLNAPMTEFATVPDPSNSTQWAPDAVGADRAWAEGVVWVELADNAFVHTNAVRSWLAGDEPLDIIPKPAWSSRDEFLAMSPAARRAEQVFRHPAMIELAVLQGALTEVITGSSTDGARIGLTRDDMAAYLADHAQRLSAYVALLASEVRDGTAAGAYREPGAGNA